MKIFKKFAAMSAAVMMMASVLSMGASAAYPDYSSKQKDKSFWELTTGTHTATCATSVSGTGSYYITRSTYGSDGGGTGGPGGCSYTLYNPYKHGWIKAVSTHTAAGYDTKHLTSTSNARYVS